MTDAQTLPEAPPAATPSPEAALWDELRTGLHGMAAIFGRPADLLLDLARLRRDILPFRAWLCALEALARALLLVMAARLPRPAPRASRIRTEPDPGIASPREAPAPPPGRDRFDVTFRAAPRTRVAADARRSSRPPRPADWADALARRYEALVRVALAPEPYARRLATALRADPSLPARILRRPLGEPARLSPCSEAIDDAFALAWAALEPVDTG